MNSSKLNEEKSYLYSTNKNNIIYGAIISLYIYFRRLYIEDSCIKNNIKYKFNYLLKPYFFDSNKLEDLKSVDNFNYI